MLILDPYFARLSTTFLFEATSLAHPNSGYCAIRVTSRSARDSRPAAATAVEAYFPGSFTVSRKEKNQRINPQRGPKRNLRHRQKSCNQRQRPGRPLICQKRRVARIENWGFLKGNRREDPYCDISLDTIERRRVPQARVVSLGLGVA
jgi:hypothetical protein